jgi:hypothetical protein
MEDDNVRDKTKQSASGMSGDRGLGVTQPRRKRPRWPLIVFGVVVVLPLLLMTAWTSITLNWVYSNGDRAGFIQKFSRKGWICKTWEGEIAMVNLPGASQERFSFTVRDDSVAREITRLMGSRVALVYAEHRGVPGSCFGDTQYYVTGVKSLP